MQGTLGKRHGGTRQHTGQEAHDAQEHTKEESCKTRENVGNKSGDAG